MKNSKTYLVTLLLLYCLCWQRSYTQEKEYSDIYFKEQRVKGYFEKIQLARSDKEKDVYNDSIILAMDSILKMPGSFNYDFDSLSTKMGKLKSPDESFRLYNWNLSYLNGSHDYFGYIQYYSKEDKEYKIFKLIDKSDEIENPEQAVNDYTHWFGALYYAIIPIKYKKDNYYTLLALDLNNLLTKKKLVEVMYFDKGIPKFGKPVFQIGKKTKNRLIFEFSAETSMSMIYDKSKKSIIYDHLSPSKPHLQGLYQYYGPDFSYDALVLKKGKWEYISDIDARNQ